MYPFPNVCALFQITSTTLRRWCRRAHIIPHVNPIDNRCRYLDDGQLVKLAWQHHRVLIVDTSDAQLSAIVQLAARIAKLEKDHQ